MTRAFRPCLAIAMFLLLIGAAAPAFAEDDTRWDMNLFLGMRTTDKDDWDPLDSGDEIGFEGTWGKEDQPLLFATDLYYSEAEGEASGVTLVGRSYELAIGLRKMWGGEGRIRPYFGAGFSLVSTQYKTFEGTDRIGETNRSPALWLGGGVFFRVGSRINLGVAARYVPARSMFINGEPRDPSAVHLGATVGWGWPGTR